MIQPQDTTYTENFAKRKCSPILPSAVNGKNILSHEHFVLHYFYKEGMVTFMAFIYFTEYLQT